MHLQRNGPYRNMRAPTPDAAVESGDDACKAFGWGLVSSIAQQSVPHLPAHGWFICKCRLVASLALVVLQGGGHLTGLILGVYYSICYLL